MARRRNNQEEDVPKQKPTMQSLKEAAKIFSYVRPYRWSLIFGLFLLSVSSLVFVGFGALFQNIIKVAEGEDFYGLSLNQIGLLMLGVLILQGLISYLRVMLFAKAAENGTADLRKDLYNKIITLPIAFFEKNKTGELVSRITSDVDRLYSAFSITIVEFIRQIILLVASITYLIFANGKLILIVILTFPVVVVLAMVFGRYIRKLSKERQKVLAETNGMLSEAVTAIQAVKAFTNEVFEIIKYGGANQRVVDISMKYARGRAIFSVFIVIVLFGALCFVIWQAAVMVQAGTIRAGDLFGFVFFGGVIGAAIGSLGNFYTEILGAIGATERVREILGMDSEVNTEEKGEPLEITGEIQYNNIEFAYPAREDVQVLKGLSLVVRPGQTVALVGQSGSGKSTIVKLLLRFYDIQGGEILVDGKDITELNITRLRENIAIVPQEVILFGGSIRENIAYGKTGATDEEIIHAAKQANAWEFISAFPESLDTLVGERGVKLSGGQRQRIAIARAILKDPAILLLDEATSSLDAESEKLVQDALDNLMEGRTSIVIAHRLATIREADQIFVMENGRIVEAGTHDELSIKEDGAYSNLAKLQFQAPVS